MTSEEMTVLERIEDKVDRLIGRVEKLEEFVSVEQEDRRIAERVSARLRDMGFEGEPPSTGVGPSPASKRGTWAHTAVELAATSGGRNILLAVVTPVVSYLLGAPAVEYLSEVSELRAQLEELQAEEAAEDVAVMPDVGPPPDPGPTGPATDTPSAPRPNL